jgi:hypothetical protein
VLQLPALSALSRGRGGEERACCKGGQEGFLYHRSQAIWKGQRSSRQGIFLSQNPQNRRPCSRKATLLLPACRRGVVLGAARPRSAQCSTVQYCTSHPPIPHIRFLLQYDKMVPAENRVALRLPPAAVRKAADVASQLHLHACRPPPRNPKSLGTKVRHCGCRASFTLHARVAPSHAKPQLSELNIQSSSPDSNCSLRLIPSTSCC